MPKPFTPSGLRNAGRYRPRLGLERRRSARALYQGHRQRLVQNHVENGHQHLHVLLRRTDFEAIGLNEELVQKYFTGTPTQVGGIGIFEVAQEAIATHQHAFGNDPLLTEKLEVGGELVWRVRAKSICGHLMPSPSCNTAPKANKYETFEEYAHIINDQSKRQMTLRGLFEFKIDPSKSIPLEQVEPAKEIVKRFATGAMSLGRISTEAHTNLAIAMNRIGGKEQHRRRRRRPSALSQRNAKGETIQAGTKLTDIIGKDVVQVDYILREGDSLRSKSNKSPRALWCDHRVLGVGRSDSDQDGAGCKTR